MQHNGFAVKRKRIFINLKIKKEVCDELKQRAYEQDLEYSEYLKKLMELEDAKAWFVDSAFAQPLTNILKQVQRKAMQKTEEERQNFRW